MGFFGPSRDEQQRQNELQLKRDERAKAFSKFQGLLQQLRPEWSLLLGDSIALTGTATHGQETLEIRIEWGSASVTDAGDLRQLPGYERVNFSVRSPSVSMSLIAEHWNRIDFKDAWNQAAFDWLAEYGQNAAPLVALRERRKALRQGLGL